MTMQWFQVLKAFGDHNVGDFVPLPRGEPRKFPAGSVRRVYQAEIDERKLGARPAPKAAVRSTKKVRKAIEPEPSDD